jgi:hypothetical protein
MPGLERLEPGIQTLDGRVKSTAPLTTAPSPGQDIGTADGSLFAGGNWNKRHGDIPAAFLDLCTVVHNLAFAWRGDKKCGHYRAPFYSYFPGFGTGH